MEFCSGIRKTVASLDNARDRRETGLFKAEGLKCVRDTIASYNLEMLLVSDSRLEDLREQHSTILEKTAESKLVITPKREFQRMSHLTTPTDIIAIYRKPENTLDLKELRGVLVLALDGVQDPGNLGTIMRAADWFGVHNIICSEDCADAFSPKSVMASMGAISRVRPVKCNLRDTISEIGSHVFGTTLEGENIYGAELSETGVIVMGSEGRGVSDKIRRLFSRELFIPSYPPGDSTSESLNVGMATSIILSEFRRRLY